MAEAGVVLKTKIQKQIYEEWYLHYKYLVFSQSMFRAGGNTWWDVSSIVHISQEKLVSVIFSYLITFQSEKFVFTAASMIYACHFLKDNHIKTPVFLTFISNTFYYKTL